MAFGVVVAVVGFAVVVVVVDAALVGEAAVVPVVIALPFPAPFPPSLFDEAPGVVGAEEVGAGVALAAGSGAGKGCALMPAIYSFRPASEPSWRYL